MGWQWQQQDHMQIICTSLQTDNHASTSKLKFLQGRCSSWRLTHSVKTVQKWNVITYLWLLACYYFIIITKLHTKHKYNTLGLGRLKLKPKPRFWGKPKLWFSRGSKSVLGRHWVMEDVADSLNDATFGHWVVREDRETEWVGARGKVAGVFETAPVKRQHFPMTNVVVHEVRDVIAHLDVCCLCILGLLVMPRVIDSSFAHNLHFTLTR